MKRKARKLTAPDWQKAREDWESGRLQSMPQVAKKWGVSLPSVKQHKRREMWRRHTEDVKASAETLPPPPSDGEPTPVDDSQPTSGGDGDTPQEARRILHAATVKRHLGQINIPLALLRQAMPRNEDGSIGKIDAKLVYAAQAASATLRNTQALERIALGLKDDDGAGEVGATTINVYLKNEFGPAEMEQLGKVTTVEPKPVSERKTRGDDAVQRRMPEDPPPPTAERPGALVLVGGSSRKT